MCVINQANNINSHPFFLPPFLSSKGPQAFTVQFNGCEITLKAEGVDAVRKPVQVQHMSLTFLVGLINSTTMKLEKILQIKSTNVWMPPW